MKRHFGAISIALFCCFWAIFSISARDLPTTTVGGRQCYVYDVKRGENIYDVSRSLGVSTGDITKYNPSAADGLRPGMRLYVPTSLVDANATETTTAEPISITPGKVPAHAETTSVEVPSTYTVGRGESLYAISRKFDMPIADIIALNPAAEYGVKQGDVLALNASAIRQSSLSTVMENADKSSLTSGRPVPHQSAAASEPIADEAPVFYDSPDRYSLVPSEERLSRSVELIDNHCDTVNMAVMLPFMLNEGGESNKTAKLYIEFYKGLLLAVDSLANRDGNYINLYAFDTAASSDTVAALMSQPVMQTMNLILGPDVEEHLDLIAGAMGPETRLYNVFNVRSSLYETSSRVIQANIPHAPMLDKAVDAFVDMYGRYTPVFVQRIDGDADKEVFTSLLKQRLDADSTVYETVTFKNLLSHGDLDTLADDRNYVFVPVSGKRAEFAKITEAIRRFGINRPEHSVRLFGYPDWMVLRGEYLNRLCELEATIYTRFYADMNDPATEAVAHRYKQTYGSEMADAAPVQGLLGFDTGMYLLGLLKDYGTDYNSHLDSYVGLQSVMSFVHQPGGGERNNALMIVTFTPGGRVIKTTIE